MRETRYFKVELDGVFAVRAMQCSRCAALIVDDEEGANRGEHAAEHERVDRLETQVAEMGLELGRLDAETTAERA